MSSLFRLRLMGQGGSENEEINIEEMFKDKTLQGVSRKTIMYGKATGFTLIMCYN